MSIQSTESASIRNGIDVPSVTIPASLSPQRGEGMRVRGEDDEGVGLFTASLNCLTPALPPLRGENSPIVTRALNP
jgi:hypothetical protein